MVWWTERTHKLCGRAEWEGGAGTSDGEEIHGDLDPLDPKSRGLNCRGECQALQLFGCNNGSLLPTR